jgi:hypothetical protein
MSDFPKVQGGEVVTPVMDDYQMKCCDCDLIHTFRFRAIRVTERLPDGSFRYDELDPTEYRVQLIAQRPEQQPPWPSKPRRGPKQPICEGCPGTKPSWRNLWTRCCGLATAGENE